MAQQSWSLCSGHLFFVQVASSMQGNFDSAMLYWAQQADLRSSALSALYTACRESGSGEAAYLL